MRRVPAAPAVKPWKGLGPGVLEIVESSVERLMNLLTALDRDVEIVIRRKPRSRKAD